METSTNYSKTAGVRRADKSENTTLFRNVYLWMTMALFITGATALTVSDSPTLLNAIFGSKVAFFGLIIAELVPWLSSSRRSSSACRSSRRR